MKFSKHFAIIVVAVHTKSDVVVYKLFVIVCLYGWVCALCCEWVRVYCIFKRHLFDSTAHISVAFPLHRKSFYFEFVYRRFLSTHRNKFEAGKLRPFVVYIRPFSSPSDQQTNTNELFDECYVCFVAFAHPLLSRATFFYGLDVSWTFWKSTEQTWCVL